MAMDPARVAAAALANLKVPTDPFTGAPQEAATLASLADILGAMITEIETYYVPSGGGSDHSGLSSGSLIWTASAHTGTANRVAAFNGSGAAAYLVVGTDIQAYSARLADIAALAVTDSNFIVGNGSTWVAESGSTVRTSLGLGSIATQNANSVSITGGSVSGITDLAVADGGTGASDASGARTNLGLAINTNVQAYSIQLDIISGITPTDSVFIVGNGTFWVGESGSTARTSLGLGSLSTASTISDSDWSGTDLAVVNGGTGASDAATARTNLGLAIGTNVQAYSARLADVAAAAVTNNNFLVANGSTWVSTTAANSRTALGLGSLATLSTVSDSNWSGTDLAVVNGGTGASDATNARANLGLGTGDSPQFTGLTLSSGGFTVTGNSTLTGDLTVTGTGARTLQIVSGVSSTAALQFVHGADIGQIFYDSAEQLVIRNDHASADLIVGVAAAEVFRLAGATGNMGVGITGPAYKFAVHTSQATGYVAQFRNTNTGTSANCLRVEVGATLPSTSAYFIEFVRGSTNAGEIWAPTTTTIGLATSSDARLKDKIRDAKRDWLGVLRGVRVRDFVWRETGEADTGVVAQELADVWPRAVNNTDARNAGRRRITRDRPVKPHHRGEDGRFTQPTLERVAEIVSVAEAKAMEASGEALTVEALTADVEGFAPWGVDKSELVFPLIGAAQDLDRLVQAQAATIAAQGARIARLEAALSAIEATLGRRF